MSSLADLLARTSRTFGISIPFLPQPARQQITVAYLLFRIADSFEDADRWRVGDRIEALTEWEEFLRAPQAAEAVRLAAKWSASPPCDNDDYNELVAELPQVLDGLGRIEEDVRERITRHAMRTAHGMAEFLRHADGAVVRLRSFEELQAYCYTVAGIVGEMLTDVFLAGWPPLEREREAMIEGSHRYGEALQLINIMKDADADRRAGRVYIPANTDPRMLQSVARAGLDAGAAYIHGLQRGGAPDGYAAFLTVPLFLGWSTTDAVASAGPGAKVGRELVGRTLAVVGSAFGESHPPYGPEALRSMWESVTAPAV